MRNMEVVVLKIEDPGCFWVAVKGCGPYIVNEVEYTNLNAVMNQFYDKSYKDVDAVKPLMVEEGQICVVFSEELKCWCRAVIKSNMYCMDHYQTECFLVDYAKTIFVKTKDFLISNYLMSEDHSQSMLNLLLTSRHKYVGVFPLQFTSLFALRAEGLSWHGAKNIRVALEAFMQIPYRAKKCRLYRTKPLTLHIDLCENTAKIVPAKRWDTAATQYFQNLLKASTQMKATLCAVEDNTFDVFLYGTIKDEKVCFNDDLVSKNFAYFEEAKENTGSSADYQENLTSLSVESLPVKTVNPALAFRPVLFQEKVSTDFETGLPVFILFLKETYRILCTDLDESTASNFQNPSEERNFVFLSNKIEPSSVLETAPLFDNLKQELTRKKHLGPNFTESYCWPPIARGCDVVAISDHGNDPFLYIPPILTLLQLGSCYKALPNGSGPLALILCPGWKKAQLVFELLQTYKKCCRQLHPMLIILGQKKEEALRVKIQKCEVIVTTPYSLLRLLEHHSLLFCRLCHLVLDEVEVLFSDAAEQVFTILDCYKKDTSEEYSVHQIIAVGTRWNKHIARLIKEFMNGPYIVITTIEEASIYGNVQQVVRSCMNSERISVLLKILDFTHNNLQKVLVFTNTVNEAEMIHKALKNNSIFSLKLHKESEFNFKFIIEQWTKKSNSGTHVVLDDCMQYLGITDATCVIHFGFPSPRVFGQRLHSMSDNFCNVLKDSSVDQEYTKARSVILLTENSECHELGILHYLQHAEAEIPPELHDFTAKMLEAEEDQKFSRPLCAYLKTFGICKNRTVCPDRHQINLQIDVPQNIPDKIIQAPGYVTILPLHIVNATNYFGRIVDKQEDQYTNLAEEMNEYFKKPGNKISVKNVEKLAFYGLCEKTLFHRVQVVEIFPKEEENLFFNVKIKYIDEGRTSQVQSCRLLQLPARFQCLPPQAVEFIVCKVKPIDNEIEWNPEVTSYICYKIKGKLHEAKIVHILGNTAWVDPMVRLTRLPGFKMSINVYNVRNEILSTGLGTDNPEHITQLQLCRHREVLDHAKNLKPLSVKEDTASPENASIPQNMSIQENSTENFNTPKIILGNHPCDGVAQTKEAEDSTLHQRKCFYPEIKWFQNEETVTVKVKIASIADYKCEFSKQKVVFSACSGDKLYLADMELHQFILAEKSTCVIKDKEAVIVLMKEKKGAWCKLLKYKNLHVSFDFEHWEDFEDKSPFSFGTKNQWCTAAAAEEFTDSSEDSGTESDE